MTILTWMASGRRLSKARKQTSTGARSKNGPEWSYALCRGSRSQGVQTEDEHSRRAAVLAGGVGHGGGVAGAVGGCGGRVGTVATRAGCQVGFPGPSPATLSRVFSQLDFAALEKALTQWGSLGYRVWDRWPWTGRRCEVAGRAVRAPCNYWRPSPRKCGSCWPNAPSATVTRSVPRWPCWKDSI